MNRVDVIVVVVFDVTREIGAKASANDKAGDGCTDVIDVAGA